MTWNIFGIEITFDLTPPPTQEELDAKLERYRELTPDVDAGLDAEMTEEEERVWTRKMEEQVDLYYELQDNGVQIYPSAEEEPAEEESTPWWKIW
jgi:TRAP-type C4-dicarboxylate transport system substrate-binding protein